MSSGACNFAQVFEEEQQEIAKQCVARQVAVDLEFDGRPGTPVPDRLGIGFLWRRYPQRLRWNRRHAAARQSRNIEAGTLSFRHLRRHLRDELADGVDDATPKFLNSSRVFG